MKDLAEQLDPNCVQISRHLAATIICRSVSEFDRLRKDDPRCPEGLKTTDDPQSKVVFVLQEMYEYSLLLIEDGRKRAKAQRRKDKTAEDKLSATPTPIAAN